MSIPEGHLRSCHEHGVVSERGDDCPCCIHGIEARPDGFEDSVKPSKLRWQVEPETMLEVIPLMEEYLDDMDQGPMWVSVATVPKTHLPAGYTVQERWFNVLRYRWESWVKTLMIESNAQETIESLRDAGYGR